MLIEKIYYADKDILDIVKSDFELVDEEQWYQLYQSKVDKSFWRLDKWDKYQEQFFVSLGTPDNWRTFDAKDLQIELLRKIRGASDSTCVWKDCANPALQGLAFCEKHAYEEMGIRK